MPCVPSIPVVLARRSMMRPFVDTISNIRDCLLEIVNFNIKGQQYVCAGELVTLQTLTKSQGAEGRYH
ncbi:hypothetical protein BGW80DRAFT_928335 [Lactifluus volemus]|nr:hypothetical protein BGW80DRAFT_928335 [Lactifluus volemus]